MKEIISEKHMNFFQEIKDSVYNPEFYRGLLNKKASFSFKYFLKLIFFISTVIAFSGGMSFLLSGGRESLANIRRSLVKLFPNDLVLTWHDGKLSSNMEEPYMIPIPHEWKSTAIDNGSHVAGYPIENLFVIDTKKGIDSGSFENYRTLAIASEEKFGFLNPEQNKIEIQSYYREGSSPESFALDQKTYIEFVNKGWKIMKIIGIALILSSPLFLSAGFAIAYLAYLLFGALFVWAAAKTCGVALTYRQSYIAGLHLITIPFVTSFLVSELLSIRFLFSFLLFIMAYVNFKQSLLPTDAVITETLPEPAQ